MMQDGTGFNLLNGTAETEPYWNPNPIVTLLGLGLQPYLETLL